MGFLDKLVNAVKSHLGAAASTIDGLTAHQAEQIKLALAPLTTAVAGLGDKAATFVLEGIEETVLLDLQAAAAKGLGELLGSPGRLRWGFSRHDNKTLIALAHASMVGRAALYASVDNKTSIEMLVRFGKILAAADAGKSLETFGAPVPDWLSYLINDALFASYKDNLNKHTPEKDRTTWDVTLIEKLLLSEALDPRLALQVVFERKGLDSYYHDRLDYLVNSPALIRYLSEHAQWTAELPQALSAAGRIPLVKRIGSDKALLAAFAPVMVALAVDSSKSVRSDAVAYLDGIVEAQRVELLNGLLRGGDTGQRAQAAELMARLPAQSGRAALEAALANEASKPVLQALRAALSRLDAVDDAGTQVMPTPPDLQPFEEVVLGAEILTLLQANLAQMLQKASVAAEAETLENTKKDKKNAYTWAKRHFDDLRKITTDDLSNAVNTLNGMGSIKERERLKNHHVRNVVAYGGKVFAHAGFGAVHLIRWLSSAGYGYFWSDDAFQKWLGRQTPGSVDLRAIAALFQSAKIPINVVAATALGSHWNAPSAVDLLPADRVWPFFIEHPHYIDEGLGLAAASEQRHGMELGATLHALSIFPVMPARWVPRLMELALGDGKTHRAAAQKALATLPYLGRQIIESLSHSKSEVRIEAAQWLAGLRYTDAVPALTTALDKETRETVRAAFLTALEALGADITPRLAPQVLLAEANKGMKAKLPAGLSWFSWEALPRCEWQSGAAVDGEIVRWWVVLSAKLKEPGGNALLTRYLSLLSPNSAQALGTSVLRQFINQDTRHPSLEQGIAYATATAPGLYQSYQSSYLRARPEHRQYYEAGYAKSQEQVFEDCKRAKMAEYLGSAIGEKGILALIAKAPGHEVVSLLQLYMRDHYQRRSQIEAMLDASASANDPVVIQLLLGISRRYRTASVLEKAKALVSEIAERNGWTQDQLADRTIPTAGLDDTGTLQLPFGERSFSVVLDAAMKPELRNPEGKAIKALPEARQNDDPAQIKESKALFASGKKELKQVIDMQTARLFEAMCTGRRWPQTEWRDYLFSHPIVGRLIQRLVWLEVEASGAVIQSFRASEDGSLLNTQDDEVTLLEGSTIQLAHACLVAKPSAEAWIKHFKDYKLQPLFVQMARSTPSFAMLDDKGEPISEINDRLGWVSDTFTLRGVFSKLGYQRAAAEDGGFFYQYSKTFASVNVRVAIEFSGNVLPEENVAAALKTLIFEDTKVRGWSDRNMALAKVPPVLLAEAYADYLAVAQSCAGFSADWEKTMPW